MEFPQFPDLPLELRDMIWDAALRAGRVVEIIPTQDYVESGYDHHSPSPPVAPLFLVCQESKTRALRFYDRVTITNSSITNKFMFNFDHDILLFSKRGALPRLPQALPSVSKSIDNTQEELSQFEKVMLEYLMFQWICFFLSGVGANGGKVKNIALPAFQDIWFFPELNKYLSERFLTNELGNITTIHLLHDTRSWDTESVCREVAYIENIEKESQLQSCMELQKKNIEYLKKMFSLVFQDDKKKPYPNKDIFAGRVVWPS